MHNYEQWWQLSADQVARKVKTDSVKGLTEQEAQQRLQQRGLNKVSNGRNFSLAKLFFNQFCNILVGVLLAVIIISALLGEWVNVLAISAIIILNALLGFIQEYKAEKSLAALQVLTQPQSKVTRDGVIHIVPSDTIVIGDLVVLEPGDLVPADGRVVKSVHLTAQESVLTGESLSIIKSTETISHPVLSLGDRVNMAFMGTVIVDGRGLMIVTETGKNAELGKLSSLLKQIPEEKTPLQRALQKLVLQLLVSCLIIVFLIFVVGLARDTNIVNLVVVVLSLAVAAIPEGLPAIITIALSLGARRMAKNNAIIRHLASVETLGRVSVICTDKTGTLTENKMEVQRIWVDNSFIDISALDKQSKGESDATDATIFTKDLELLFTIATLCNNAQVNYTNNAWKIVGDPTEVSLLQAAYQLGIEKKLVESRYTRLQEIPFDSNHKMMSILVKHAQEHFIFVKGAFDLVLNNSSHILIQGEIVPLTETYKNNIIQANNIFAEKALRVLGFAYRPASSEEIIENNLIFIGLIGIIDPPRAEAKHALEQCKRAGIKTIMITGDHQSTARAIALELGMMEDDSLVVNGDELENMSEETLKSRLRNITIYSRTSGTQKLKIVRAWQALGEVVAMTGDGVNDAPAIKAADMGIAMGSGTEVTKAASDMILLDNNFASIVKAVKEGRAIFDNIVKFVNYMISTNVAELFTVFLGTFLVVKNFSDNKYLFISLLPLQILWINLITDGIPALALTLDPLDPHVMEKKPRKVSASILSIPLMTMLFITGLIMAATIVIAASFVVHESIILARTLVFTLLIIFSFIRIQTVRVHYNLTIFSNKWLMFALAGSCGMQLIIIYTPLLQHIFETGALRSQEWIIASIAILFIILFNGIVHLFLKKYLKT